MFSDSGAFFYQSNLPRRTSVLKLFYPHHLNFKTNTSQSMKWRTPPRRPKHDNSQEQHSLLHLHVKDCKGVSVAKRQILSEINSGLYEFNNSLNGSSTNWALGFSPPQFLSARITTNLMTNSTMNKTGVLLPGATQ